MSWSGFKKNVGRATTQVMMKTGHVEKTSDRSYDVEERRYRTLESASLRLQKEAKGYLDSLRAMTASQMRIAETIDAFYGDSGAKDGVSRSYKQAVEDLDAETVKALDGPYRTTVLEPINRFCNYFPDINECIKKRNHKMLDYDALRAKVKKLTEKPDKDPAKLPRTEKETEMVSAHSSFDMPSSLSNIYAAKEVTGDHQEDDSDELDLEMPSPPKALQRPEIQRLKQAQRPPRESSLHSAPVSSTFSNRSGTSSSKSPAGFEHTAMQHIPSIDTRAMLEPAVISRSSEDDELSIYNASGTRNMGTFSLSSPSSSSTLSKNANTTQTEAAKEIRSSNVKARSMESSRSEVGRRRGQSRPPLPTPFFQPSELEELMAPFKQEFIQRQADNFAQAKASYEQLNEQLTSELPQLIDLRVPYLDPSFEALVKIQLRFCAEAYSRMAQVQQYLDASTRDQYASGDLDARVEEVLGQIRELSIAGTV